jgi:hypothetical protein
MKMRTIGLIAACLTVGVFNASAQNVPDKPDKQEAPGKADMPSSESGKSAREPGAKESAGERSSSQKMNAPDGQRDKAAQDTPKGKDRDRAQGEEKKKGSSAQNEQPKSDKANEKASSESKSQDKAAQSKSDTKQGDKSAERDKAKSDDKGRDSASGTSSGESGSSSPGKLTEDKKKVDEAKKVQISGERRDRVQAGFKSHGDIKHETKTNVNLSIGSRAPREWAFTPVPSAVIEVVPEYRGYVYAYVGDDYVVCDPDTYEIVAVLPASGSGGSYASSGGGSAKCSTSLTLNEDDREAIIRSVELRNEVNVSGVSVGWSVPGDVELRSFPSTVVERRSELGACRYFIANDQIAVVDPDQEKVVLLIEQR